MFKNTHLFIYSGIFIDAKPCCKFQRQHRTVSPLHTNLQAVNFQRLKCVFTCPVICLVYVAAWLCFCVLYCTVLIEYSNPLCLCQAQDAWKRLWKQRGCSQYFCNFQGTVSSVQLLSHVQLFGVAATPWTAARQASLSITNSWSLPKLVSIELVMPSSHFILCDPFLLLLSIFPNIWVFSNESALRIRWPKDWSFCFSISPSNEYSGRISLRMDWLDLLAVQGTLKSLLQHYSSKASILRRSAFFSPSLTSIHDYEKNHSFD